MAYTTETKIENYLLTDIDSSFSSQVSDWITAAENWINNYTRKVFESASEVRYFDGSGKSILKVDDFVTIATIQILEANGSDVAYTLTEGADNDFIVEPYNVTPKYILKMTVNSQITVWPRGKRRIQLTAAWGHSTNVPKDVELAATILVAGVIEKGMKGGGILSESLGDYSVTYAALDEIATRMGVKSILDRYRIYELF